MGSRLWKGGRTAAGIAVVLLGAWMFGRAETRDGALLLCAGLSLMAGALHRDLDWSTLFLAVGLWLVVVVAGLQLEGLPGTLVYYGSTIMFLGCLVSVALRRQGDS